MNLTNEEVNALCLALSCESDDPCCGAEFFRLRAQIATQLFVGSVKTEEGAREAVQEADMLLRKLLK